MKAKLKRIKLLVKLIGILRLIRSKIINLIIITKLICKLKKNYFTHNKDELVHDKDELVVSVTTFGNRAKYLKWTIISIINQRYAGKFLLRIYVEKSIINTVNNDIKKIKPLNVDIKVVEVDDIGPHTKLLYALDEYPNSMIITADDDIIYPDWWLDNLVEKKITYPNCIIASRAHCVSLNNEKNGLGEYKYWQKNCNDIKTPSFQLFATGVGGVLYERRLFNSSIFDVNIREITRTCDDVHFYFVALNSGTQTVLTDRRLKLQEFHISNKIDLYTINVENNNNDVSIEEIKTNMPDLYDKVIQTASGK